MFSDKMISTRDKIKKIEINSIIKRAEKIQSLAHQKQLIQKHNYDSDFYYKIYEAFYYIRHSFHLLSIIEKEKNLLTFEELCRYDKLLNSVNESMEDINSDILRYDPVKFFLKASNNQAKNIQISDDLNKITVKDNFDLLDEYLKEIMNLKDIVFKNYNNTKIQKKYENDYILYLKSSKDIIDFLKKVSSFLSDEENSLLSEIDSILEIHKEEMIIPLYKKNKHIFNSKGRQNEI